LLCAAIGLLFASAAWAWENSLGMKFAPVPGTDVLCCVWETRVKDFAAFIKATGHDAGQAIYVYTPEGKTELRPGANWRNPGFAQAPDHPVVGVSWEDAQAFCRWLTEHERRSGLLALAQKYRLPTDAEWSRAAGLTNEPGPTPQARFLQVKDIYPWGNFWPPPRNAGNYAESLAVDGFARTAPVGSFAPNALGLYDLGGNACEWCEDWWNGQRQFRVLRGAAWNLDCSLCLMSSYRFPNFPDMRLNTYGFRVVVEGSGDAEALKR
jgi:formylglycine-generating enzyme required for sulfatase activity